MLIFLKNIDYDNNDFIMADTCFCIIIDTVHKCIIILFFIMVIAYYIKMFLF